ncbi:GGDEF domain-containing protein [uncultured Jatrophihabitans sp.]|uniref:GGDEF domain-containing protein n=1 Tax=uncultured Jatrophihabitans sp. TaxID=1610747 RepID=UPI0035CC9E76
MDSGREDAVVVPEDLIPAQAFDLACIQVVKYLSRLIPMGLWAVTRVANGQSVLLAAEDHAYGFGKGAALPFVDMPCHAMVTAGAPPIAPDATLVPAYAESGFARLAPLGAYVGFPVTLADGELFGTVCGYDPSPQPSTLLSNEPLFRLVAVLLSAVLTADLVSTDAARDIELLKSEADSDQLTGLLNRRGWDRYVSLEAPRYERFGDPAAVLVIDLDGLKTINDVQGHVAGDQHLRRAAETLRRHVRAGDALARLGGDEFGVFAKGVSPAQAGALVDRMVEACSSAGIEASIGWAPVQVGVGIKDACIAADQSMYEQKRKRRHTARVPGRG